MLGHKNIKYSLKYTRLANFQDDDYICKVARKPEEIKELIESGFECVTDQLSSNSSENANRVAGLAVAPLVGLEPETSGDTT